MKKMLKEFGYFAMLFVPISIIILTPELAGDRGYILRMVQSGGYETVYLLIGTILGLVLRDISHPDGVMALSTAVGAVVTGMLLGAFTSLEGKAAWLAGVALASSFLTCLFMSIFHTFSALKHLRLKEEARKDETPSFVRTPPPRRR